MKTYIAHALVLGALVSSAAAPAFAQSKTGSWWSTHQSAYAYTVPPAYSGWTAPAHVGRYRAYSLSGWRYRHWHRWHHRYRW
jgi:hypothetical protein